MQFTIASITLLATATVSFAAAIPAASTTITRGAVLHTRDNICGVAPSNTTATTATNDAAAMDVSIDTNVAAGCLDFCKDTSGCLSAEYGTTVSGGDNECLLFTVAASALAAPTDGQSLVAFDVDCTATYKD